jgi:hypothetical protein
MSHVLEQEAQELCAQLAFGIEGNASRLEQLWANVLNALDDGMNTITLENMCILHLFPKGIKDARDVIGSLSNDEKQSCMQLHQMHKLIVSGTANEKLMQDYPMDFFTYMQKYGYPPSILYGEV